MRRTRRSSSRALVIRDEAPEMTLQQKVDLIVEKLQDSSFGKMTGMCAIIKQANKIMGLEANGLSLPAQADALLEAIG